MEDRGTSRNDGKFWKDVPWIKQIVWMRYLQSCKEEDMKRSKEEVKNHHPYCQDNYLNPKNTNYNYGNWTCRCAYLKAYDEWRHTLLPNEKEQEKLKWVGWKLFGKSLIANGLCWMAFYLGVYCCFYISLFGLFF